MSHGAIYRDHAEVYASFADASLPNAYYDRPAILRLAGDIKGQRILELGCAGGGLTAHLVEGGGEVLALDREPRLVAIAQRRLGPAAQVRTADLEEPLDMVASSSMDLVVASLVLHYLEDWGPLLRELRRVLVPGGVFVFSIHHPITGWLLSDQTDYHRTELIHESWDWDGVHVTAGMYRRPLKDVFGSLLSAGMIIDAVDEPLPQPSGDGADPRITRVLETLPVFLFVRARAAPDI